MQLVTVTTSSSPGSLSVSAFIALHLPCVLPFISFTLPVLPFSLPLLPLMSAFRPLQSAFHPLQSAFLPVQSTFFPVFLFSLPFLLSSSSVRPSSLQALSFQNTIRFSHTCTV